MRNISIVEHNFYVFFKDENHRMTINELNLFLFLPASTSFDRFSSGKFISDRFEFVKVVFFVVSDVKTGCTSD